MIHKGLILFLCLLTACTLTSTPNITPTVESGPLITATPDTTRESVFDRSTPTDSATQERPTPLPIGSIATAFPTVAISVPIPPTVFAASFGGGEDAASSTVDPGVRGIVLDSSAGLTRAEFALPGNADFIAFNPVDLERYARVDSVGLLHFVPAGGNEGLYTFPPFFAGFSASSATDNKLRVEEVEWSPNGQFIAFRIASGHPEANDGVWFWQPAQELATDPSYHLLRDCPPGCNLVAAGNASEWRSLALAWSSDNQAILVTLELPPEGRRGLAVVQAVRDPETMQSRTAPTVLRYDYGHWASDGQRLIVSGTDPEGRIGFGSVARDGSTPLLTAAATIGLAWVQDAVQRPDSGQIIMLGSEGGPGGALRLYDDSGKALTGAIGAGPPQRVNWSPDRRAVLVVVNGRSYIAQSGGGVIEITEEVAGTQAINWSRAGLPVGARRLSGGVPTGVLEGSRYNPGQQLRVYVRKLDIYQQPGFSSDIVGQVLDGEYVAILAGPAEADGVSWWQVQTVRSLGWIVDEKDGIAALGP